MKKRGWVALLLVVITTVTTMGVTFAQVPPPQAAAAPSLQLQTPSALLMDAGTGKILFAKNEHDKRPMASITKVMTMLLVMEAVDSGRVKLSDKVVASRKASSMGGSTMFLDTGEPLPLEEVMTGIAVNSANDGAVAAAEFIAGSEEAFVELMNARAQQLGMNDTTFKNAHGLHENGHVSSAYDIAIMSRELLKYPKIHEWMTIWHGQTRKYDLDNTNRLIHDYPGADGLKTGYTDESLHSVSATAIRNDLRLVAVILGAPTAATRWNEAAKLLDYGFANYSAVPIVDRSQVIQQASIEKGTQRELDLMAEDSLKLLFTKGQEPKHSVKISVEPKLAAPIKKGQVVGQLTVVDQDSNELAKVNLVAATPVERLGFFGVLSRCWQSLLTFRMK